MIDGNLPKTNFLQEGILAFYWRRVMGKGIKSRAKTIVRELVGRAVGKEAVAVPMLYGNMLEGRRAIVTGGTSGIGRSIAEAFTANGANVIVTGRSKDRAQYVARELSKDAYGIAMDIRAPDSISAAVIEACSLFGTCPDILVNCAGINGGGKLGSVEPDAFDAVIETNLRGTMLVSQEVARRMIKAKTCGNILNISSSSALRPANTPYIISKWGIRGLTLGMAKSLTPYDIVVNAIAPGPTATPMLHRDNTDVSRPQSPVGRYAAPEEIASMAVVLVSSIGRMVVGDTVYMTGGSGLITFDDTGDYDFVCKTG